MFRALTTHDLHHRLARLLLTCTVHDSPKGYFAQLYSAYRVGAVSSEQIVLGAKKNVLVGF